MHSDPDELLQRHQELVHADEMKVSSHVQRASGEWFTNTVMLEGYDVPFRYQRKKKYKDLKGAIVNVTFYAATFEVAGMKMEVMNVVRIKRH
jgi:hypothetical protein